MAKYANAILAKARAMYGKMLSPDQYDDLLRKQSVQEISAYLRENTPYAAALEGVQDSTVHRGQLESLLHRDLFAQYVRLARYVTADGADSGIYGYVVADLEVELILACLRGLMFGSSTMAADIPAFLEPYASFPIFQLVDVKTLDQLCDVVKNTPYGPLLRRCAAQFPPEQGEQHYAFYEQALRVQYFERLLEAVRGTAKGEAARQLHELITIRAELLNLNTIYRLKMFFHADAARIRQQILPICCRLNRRQLDELVEAKDAEEFMRLLCETSYGKTIRPGDAYLESRTDPIRYTMNRHTLRFSTDPQVVYLAFMMLRSMETEDIIRIIEGVRYRLPPEKIEQLLYQH